MEQKKLGFGWMRLPVLQDGEIDMEQVGKMADLFLENGFTYHNSTSNSGEMFDRKLAERWNAPNRLIVYPGEEIEIK